MAIFRWNIGLNHVVRKWSEPTDRCANMLIPVPNGRKTGLPGGVLVLAENYVLYQNRGHPDVRTPIPRRTDLPESRGVLLIASATLRQKNLFFVLVQSEYGDLYRVTLVPEGDQIVNLKVKYYDTIPPSKSLCISKTGLLLAASEFGDHCVYQVQSIGDGDDTVEVRAEQTHCRAQRSVSRADSYVHC